jgi:hypothetical protein
VRRRVALLVVAVLLGSGTAGCGDRGTTRSGAQLTSSGDLKLSVAFDEPLRSGHGVTWHVSVENPTTVPRTLRFSSGKEADVTLQRGGGVEVYRWSGSRFFSQALRQLDVGPGETEKFTLKEETLSVPIGDYELWVSLASEPAPPPTHRAVQVHGG